MQRLLDFSLQVEAEQARRTYEAAFERAQNRLVDDRRPEAHEGRPREPIREDRGDLPHPRPGAG